MGSRCSRWIFMIFFVFVLHPAEGEAKEQAGEKISVRAVLPENQYDKEKTYFDLMMNPGERQIIQIEVENKGEEAAEIEAVIRPAYTNGEGMIEYGENQVKPDTTLKYNISEIVSVSERTAAAAGETIFLDLEIKMPGEEYEGVIAGGITVQKVSRTKGEKPEEEQEEKNIAVINEYSYVIGIVLRENEKEVKPQLNVRYITADNAGMQSNIKVNLQNEKAVFVEDMKIEAQIRKKGEKKVLYETKAEKYRMAPNSNFDFLIKKEGEKLEAGSYTLYFNAVCGNKSWNWKEDFTIKDQGVTEEEVEPADHTLFLAVSLLSVLAVISIGLYIRKRSIRSSKR